MDDYDDDEDDYDDDYGNDYADDDDDESQRYWDPTFGYNNYCTKEHTESMIVHFVNLRDQKLV